MKQSRSRTENAKRIIISSLFRQMLDSLTPFVMRTVIIYTLGSLYLGINSLFASILQVLNLAELGFSDAVVFSMYRPLANGDKEKVNALMNLYRRAYRIIGICVFGAGLAVMPFLRRLISGEVPVDINLYAVYLLTLLQTCVGYWVYAHKTALFFADQRGDVLSNIRMLMQLLLIVMQITALLVFHNYYLYCAASILSSVGNNLLVNYMSKRRYPEFICSGRLPKNEVREIWQKISGLFINRFCYVCRNSFDSVTVSAYMGLTAVSVFQNYYSILSAVTKASSLLGNGMLASVGNAIATESKKKNFQDFQKFQLIIMWITGWCTVCLFCLYQPFMRLWMGQERMLSEVNMAVYCVYYFVDMMSIMCYIYRQAAGLYQQRKFVPVFASAVNITLNILLVQRFGMIGVLLSTIFCQIVIDASWTSGILFDYYFTEEKQSQYLLRLLIYGMITAAAAAVTRLVCSLVPLNGLLELLAKGCICAAVPNVVFLLLLRQLPEFADAMRFVKEKLVKRRNA